MKKVKVIVKDATTLELLEAGEVGDIIDLNEILAIDQTLIINAIEKGKDEVYRKKLADAEQAFKLKLENELNEQKLTYSETVNALKNKIENLTAEQTNLLTIKEQQVKALYEGEKFIANTKISELENTIAQLKLAQTALIEQTKSEKEAEKMRALHEKDLAITKIQEQLNIKEKDHELVLNKQKSQYEANIAKLKEELAIINREKALKSVKTIGENLESWCNEQMKAAMVYGFKTSTWIKDNESIKLAGESKGTKGDYILRVYDSTDVENRIEVTSVMLDMKSQEEVGTDRQKNSNHYNKLDLDRNKKGCEYAVLVSELEYESENDAPIFIVHDYPKMFVVRPPYFLTLLGVIESIGLKNSELMRTIHQEKIAFKESQTIIDEFEQFKNNILENSLKNIENNVEKIKDEADKIEKSVDTIRKSIRLVNETHLQTLRRKIEDYQIVNTVKKIDKIN